MNKFNLIKNSVVIILLAFTTSFTVRAEIIEQSKNSFTVKHSFTSNANTASVRHKFAHIGQWWLSEFTQSGKGENMFFNGDCLCEKLPNGKTITYLKKLENGDNQWTWLGAFGQLRNENINGKMTVGIKKHHYGTNVTLEYVVKNEALTKHHHLPTNIDSMLGAQLKSLKGSLMENKSPARVTLR